MTTDYSAFLKNKHVKVEYTGFDVSPERINTKAFLFQNAVIRRALQVGRYALFEECGLGKSFQEHEFGRLVSEHTNKPAILLTPLAVAQQHVREGEKFGIQLEYIREPEDLKKSSAGVFVTNYDRVDRFDFSDFSAVILDESGILKNLGGKTFWKLVRTFEKTPYKLCGTATPAPNDYVEFSNHSTFLGIMHFKEVLARWFTGSTGKIARSSVLKAHGEDDFWYWLTSWAVCLSNPSDLGEPYAVAGYNLPPLNLIEHRLAAAQASIERAQAQGFLLPDTNPSSVTLHKVKRESLQDRINKARELVEAIPDNEPVILWCDTNYEADALKKAFPDAVEVRGSETSEAKEDKLNAFSEQKTRMIITKPDLAGFGLNWYHCSNMVFIGVSFSFEKTYQALRRSYRFGQTKEVNAHMIYAETEGNVMSILDQKRRDFQKMQTKMNAAMAKHGLFRAQEQVKFISSEGTMPMILPKWIRPLQEVAS
jgi:hypothetical protein